MARGPRSVKRRPGGAPDGDASIGLRPPAPRAAGRPGEVRLLALELDRPTTSADRELGEDAPGEVVERVRRHVPRREDGRRQPLDVAVRVARDRADVVRGEDPGSRGDAPQREHDAEPRPLVLVGAARVAA